MCENINEISSKKNELSEVWLMDTLFYLSLIFLVSRHDISDKLGLKINVRSIFRFTLFLKECF